MGPSSVIVGRRPPEGNEEEEEGKKKVEKDGGKWEEGKMEEGRVADPDVEFPINHLVRLDENLSRPEWVVPIRPGDDLEKLLRASIALCKQGKEWNMCIQYGIVQCNRVQYSTI